MRGHEGDMKGYGALFIKGGSRAPGGAMAYQFAHRALAEGWAGELRRGTGTQLSEMQGCGVTKVLFCQPEK